MVLIWNQRCECKIMAFNMCTDREYRCVLVHIHIFPHSVCLGELEAMESWKQGAHLVLDLTF